MGKGMSGDATESRERQAPAGPPSAASPSDVSIDAFVSYASAPVANPIFRGAGEVSLRSPAAIEEYVDHRSSRCCSMRHTVGRFQGAFDLPDLPGEGDDV